MNLDNWNHWLRTLEEGDLPQTQSVLHRLTPYEMLGGKTIPAGYCCLGVGCAIMPGAEATMAASLMMYGGQETLAPWAFIKWLGLDHAKYREGAWKDYDESTLNGVGWDIEIDMPAIETPNEGTLSHLTCAGMNDECRLTFPQIADMLRYFGVRRITS